MEHAPYSPIASTSRATYQFDSPLVPTSDFGEREESEAASGGEGYWTERVGHSSKGKGREQQQATREAVSSDDELAMSPIRPRKYGMKDGPGSSDLSSKTPRKRTRSPSPLPDSAPISVHSSPVNPRVSSPTSSIPLESTRKKQRSISPASSDSSLRPLDEIARPKPTSELGSPSSSPPLERSPTPPRRSLSPAAEEPFPVLSPSPEPAFPAGRSFRTRTAAQLKPFSTEQFKYTKSLLRNGWAGAVVAGPKAVELSSEEIRRKKLEQAGRKKDDLGGWLVEEAEGDSGEERRVRLAKVSHSSTGDNSEEEESEDGMTILEREARRKERMGRQADAALGIKRKPQSRKEDTSLESRFAVPDHSPPNALFVPKKPRRRPDSNKDKTSSRPSTSHAARRPRAESEPPSSSPGTASRRRKERSRGHGPSEQRYGTSENKGDRSSKHSRSTTTARADSEPPASSPARPRAFVSNNLNSRMGKPSKSMHARDGRTGRNALDADILNLPDMPSCSESDSDEVEIQSLNGESEVPEESEEGSEEEAEEGEESPKSRRSRLRLDKKRERALGSMLPAVFFKKAKADLKLMEKEREMGLSSGSEANSGDEEAEEARKNRAKIRTVAGMRDEPMRLDGDAFTDESGEEPDRTDSEAEEEEQQENDAVSAWMRNFAPKRGGGGKDDEVDIVDRFLKRARRPTKGGIKGKRSGGKNGKVGSKRKGKENVDTGEKGKRKRSGGTKERDDRTKSAQPGISKRPSRPVKAISLDTDRSIFVFAGMRDEREEPQDDDVVIVDPPRLPPARIADSSTSSIATTTQIPFKEEDSEIWASFGKFTPDFDIRRLPSGIQFASTDSFIGNGHLYSLLHPSAASPLSCDVYGLTFDSNATPETIESQLPTLVDAIFDSIATAASSALTSDSDPSREASRALRFLGSFISSRLSSTSSDIKHRFGSALASQLDHLELRLDNIDTNSSFKQSLSKIRIILGWYAVDLTARLGTISAVGGDSRRLARLATHLVRRLVKYGVDRTLQTLKKVMESGQSGELRITDETVEAWVGLVTLATRTEAQGDATFDQGDLWTTVTEETFNALPEKARNGGPITGEVISLTTMLLCAISQFSPSGISTSTPRLHAHWPAMLRTLDSIKPTTLAAPDHNVSSTAIARRDRYLWTLFARCLVLVERWGWKVDVKDDLLAKLFDLVAARRLSNFSTEPVGDFPSFLVDLAKFGKISFEAETDTAFAIFLKLVKSAVNNLPSSTDADKRKRSTQLTRLSVRLAPMTTAWTQQSPELTKSDSILINHYSLLLTLAVLHPAQASQKVEQASKLANFSETAEDARKTTIRAIRYYALAFRHFDIPTQPLLEWLAKIVQQLKTEYIDVEKQRKNPDSWMKRGERADKSKEDQLWPRALLITMTLRLVQDVLRWKRPGTKESSYPDPALLNSAWTSQLLQSPLALDPMIGREILKTVECFLNLRQTALSSTASPAQSAPAQSDPAQQDSQDDYGMDEFDFEDPALNALLGVEGAEVPIPDDSSVVDKAARDSDKVLAEVIKSSLAPAFFHLVSNIYGNSVGSGPTVGDRASYAENVVECWTRCIAILVSHGLDTWVSYLRYGNYSFQRIGDPLGRLDISLFLAIRILQNDPSIYSSCTEEILSIWFSTIVSSKLTAQHVFTEVILNTPTLSPLFASVPARYSRSIGRYEVDQLELLDTRLDILKVVFSNAAQMANFQSSASAPFAKPPISKTLIMRFLRDMLGAMRSNLNSIRDEMAKRSYAKVIKEVLQALTAARGGSTFNDTNLPDIGTLRVAISHL
ncbi:hypothetical protein JCM5353_000681 [Sporobolomyces roseus]